TSETPEVEVDEDATSETPEVEVDEDTTSETPEAEVDEDSTSETPEAEVDEDTTSETPEAEVDEDTTSDTPEEEVDEDTTSETPEVEVDEDSASETPEVEVDEDSTSETPGEEGNEVYNVEGARAITVKQVLIYEEQNLKSSVTLEIAEEEEIEIKEISGEWSLIGYEDKQGWLLLENIQLTNVLEFSLDKGLIEIYLKKGETALKREFIRNGTLVVLVKDEEGEIIQKGNWFQVVYKGEIGWINNLAPETSYLVEK